MKVMLIRSHFFPHEIRAKFNNQEVDALIRKFTGKWEILRRKYTELFRNCDKDLVVTIESNLPGFMEALKDLFRVSRKSPLENCFYSLLLFLGNLY